jgi:V8-like Glu-specific endopeptidase
MSVQLPNKEFNDLIRIVAMLRAFGTAKTRFDLVTRAFSGRAMDEAGAQRTFHLMYGIDYEGDAITVATEVIAAFSQFGQLEPGKEALAIFTNTLLDQVGEGKEADTLRRVLELVEQQTQTSGAAVVPPRPIDKWRDPGVDDNWVKEKIIGENTLRHINLLMKALDAAQSVVHLRVNVKNYGTGFLIGDSLVMTNNHVIKDAAEAAATEYTFNYQFDIDGKEEATQPAQRKADGLFYTNPTLDFTIVELQNVPADYARPLPLRTTPVDQAADRIAIIQHPGGNQKQISMQNNLIAYADASVLQYTTSTMPGSSGAPIFDEEFRVIGIHHSGGNLLEPGSAQRYLRNAGSTITAVIKDVQANAPDIYARLKRV